MNGKRIALAGAVTLVASWSLALSAGSAAPPPAAAGCLPPDPLAAGEPLGTLYFSEDFNEDGLFTLSMVDGASVNVGVSGVTSATVGLAPSADDDRLLGSKPSVLMLINADGSGSADIGGVANQGLAYDADTDTLYGMFSSTFRRLDAATGMIIETLASLPEDADGKALAVGGGGVFALAADATSLFFYDPGAGDWSVVGNTGLEWPNGGVAYNACEERLYAKRAGDATLYRIDPLTAAVMPVGDTERGLGGGLAWVGSCEIDPCPDCPCPGDIDRDGEVGTRDLVDLLAAWGDCPPRPRGGTGTLWGLASGSPGRLYTVDPQTGAAMLVVDLEGDATAAGLALLADVLYGSDLFDFPGESGTRDTGEIDPATGAITFVSSQDYSFAWHGLAANEAGGVLYAVDLDIAQWPLRTLTADGTEGTVGTGTGILARGLAYDDATATLYAVDDDELHTIDTTTGEATPVGELGFTTDDRMGLAFDEVTRTLYLNVGDTGGANALYTVDVETGAATLVGDNLVTGIDGLAWQAPPDGACCLADGSCADAVIELVCTTELGSTWQGAGTLCAETECPLPCDACPCPEDVDRDGRVAVRDLVDLISSWGPCK